MKDILRTRMALAEKLELLEQRVEEKVQGTRSAAIDVITHAKNTVVDFMESTSEQLDPTVQAGRRPWLLVGGAIAIGFLAGWMDTRRRNSGVYPYYPERAKGADVMPSEADWEHRRGVYPYYPAQTESDQDAAERRAERPRQGSPPGTDAMRQVASLWSDFTEQFAKERLRLQEAALQTGRSFIQDLAHIVAQSLIDAITRRPQASSPSRQEPARERMKLAS
ncbi:hypothetical protein NITMOv2_2796 [Nitrospira moscoviensis]|uniref:DUF3618 domain-containing protein n=1 Tax=Nitrospira moscoviensis TaxID=42253 RepID=A0A0K2GE17_NITMO|nr:hypothetical protein NITMOv2_2796 [Nitrospira moscoviensis]